MESFLLNLITLGIYNLYLVHCFAKETNIACAEDGRSTKGLVAYFFLGLITFGIYDIVWTCNWIDRCNGQLRKSGKQEGLQVSTYLLTVLLLGPLTLGIMSLVVYCKELYLQNKVNATYNERMGLVEIVEIV